MDTGINIGQALESLSASHRAVTNRLAKLLEATDHTQLIDPRDAYVDDSGEVWAPVGYGTGINEFGTVYRNEPELERVRNLCRWFSDENEFAINSHENRVSYVVGWGHTYHVVSKPGEDAPEADLKAVQQIVEQFLKLNRWSPSYVCGREAGGRQSWGHKQQQNVKRRDRDGEVFLRKFRHEDGILRVRYIEPEAVRTPPTGANASNAWGIVTDPEDAETVVAYLVNGQEVGAEHVQHRTRDGSPQNPRGVPIHYPVRKNLLRAQKILRNGSTVTEVQAAIAMIRKHAQATKATVQALVSATATDSRTDAAGNTKYLRQYAPGTILDANAQIEYQFPGMGIDPSKYVASLQAELRAVAARLVMPEFMLTSDASNANFSSTMVAEGPAVKMFQRLQWDEISYDLELIWDALRWAAESGLVKPALLELIDVQAEAPIVQSRDRLKDAQTAQVLDGLGWLSPQTGSAMFDLDYLQEQENREQHNERMGLPPTGVPPQLMLPPAPGEDEPREQDGDSQDEPNPAAEAYNPQQPRVPAGSSAGGQFGKAGGGPDMKDDQETLAKNIAANPSPQAIFDDLRAEATRLNLGNDGASDYVSQGGTRYLNIGRKINQHHDWNDELKLRIGNHGGRHPEGVKEIHLTTTQSPALLQSNILRAKARMAELASQPLYSP